MGGSGKAGFSPTGCDNETPHAPLMSTVIGRVQQSRSAAIADLMELFKKVGNDASGSPKLSRAVTSPRTFSKRNILGFNSSTTRRNSWTSLPRASRTLSCRPELKKPDKGAPHNQIDLLALGEVASGNLANVCVVDRSPSEVVESVFVLKLLVLMESFAKNSSRSHRVRRP